MEEVDNHEASGFSNVPDVDEHSTTYSRDRHSEILGPHSRPIHSNTISDRRDLTISPLSPCYRQHPSHRDSGYLTDSPASFTTSGGHFFSPNNQNLEEETESRNAANEDLEDSGVMETGVLLEDTHITDSDVGIEMRPSDEVFEEEDSSTIRQITPPSTSPISIPRSPRPVVRSVGDYSPDVVPVLGLGHTSTRHTQYTTSSPVGARSSPLHVMSSPFPLVSGARVTSGTQTPHPTAHGIDFIVHHSEHEQAYHGSDGVMHRRVSIRGTAACTMIERRDMEEFESRTRADSHPLPRSQGRFATGTRAQSVPTITPLLRTTIDTQEIQAMGRELRLISDEFHHSYSGEHEEAGRPHSFPEPGFFRRWGRRLGLVREEQEPPTRRHSTSAVTRHAHHNHK